MNQAVAKRTKGRVTTTVDVESLVEKILSAKVCAHCHGSLDLFGGAVDHVTPLSRGGLHVLENLVVAGEPCNRAEGDLLVDEFREWLAGVARRASPS